jgi:hypothetical protein
LITVGGRDGFGASATFVCAGKFPPATTNHAIR